MPPLSSTVFLPSTFRPRVLGCLLDPKSGSVVALPSEWLARRRRVYCVTSADTGHGGQKVTLVPPERREAKPDKA